MNEHILKAIGWLLGPFFRGTGLEARPVTLIVFDGPLEPKDD